MKFYSLVLIKQDYSKAYTYFNAAALLDDSKGWNGLGTYNCLMYNKSQ